MTQTDCVFCLSPGAMSVKLTKKGLPFFRCYVCGSKAFIYTKIAERTLLLTRELVGRIGAGTLQASIDNGGKGLVDLFKSTMEPAPVQKTEQEVPK